MSNTETVLGFIKAMGENDKGAILAFFDDESVFNNIPMGTVRGADSSE